jgi:acyl-CoA dehydrogenase
MDFRLTDEQEQMQETARDLFESEDVLGLARRQLDDDDVVEETWDLLTGVDYPALTVPVEYGGLGDGMVNLAVLLEAAGRHALPAPYPETAAFAVPLVAELGTDAQRERLLPQIADGELTFSPALYDDRNEPLPRAVQLAAEPTDEGYVLDGTKTLVPYGGLVDRVVVAARTRQGTGYGGITLFVVDPSVATDVTRLDGLDRTRPPFELAFDGVTVPEDARIGPLHGGGDAPRRALDRFRVGICAMLVGAADRAVDLSVEYGNERTQFGHPIGQFQAVKHRIAEMWIDMQAGRSLVYYAAWALETDDHDAERAVSAAKAYCADNYSDLFGDDIRNHGGMGFTWDHDGHIYLKQAKAWEQYLGDATDHYDRVADIRGV